MGIDVEHFDLTGRNALVLSAETPAGQAIADAYAEAGARVMRLNTPSPGDVGGVMKHAAADMGGLQILASAPDRFLAKPVTAITPDGRQRCSWPTTPSSSMPARPPSRSCCSRATAARSCWSPTC